MFRAWLDYKIHALEMSINSLRERKVYWDTEQERLVRSHGEHTIYWVQAEISHINKERRLIEREIKQSVRRLLKYRELYNKLYATAG